MLPSAHAKPSTSGHLAYPDRAWAAICKRAGLLHVTIHILRHTFATRLISAGASLPQVGAALGHAPGSSATMIYAHVEVGALLDVLDRAEAAATVATERPQAAIAAPVKMIEALDC